MEEGSDNLLPIHSDTSQQLGWGARPTKPAKNLGQAQDRLHALLHAGEAWTFLSRGSRNLGSPETPGRRGGEASKGIWCLRSSPMDGNV